LVLALLEIHRECVKIMDNKNKISNRVADTKNTKETTGTEPQLYEAGYLLSPVVSPDAVNDEAVILRSVIENAKGLILNECAAKNRQLAYAIKKHDNAYFGWIRFMSRPEMLAQIQKEFEKNNNLLRFLLLKIKQEAAVKKTKPKPLKPKKIVVKPTVKLSDKEKTEQTKEIDKKLEEILNL